MSKAYFLMPAMLAASIAHANTGLSLPDTVVTASRIEQPRAAVSAAVTVFTREDIERLNPADVPALLQRVPGLHISRTGGQGSLTGLFLRGTASPQTLVLVDGQRISGSSSGITSLELLNIAHIERIEVVRGGRSAVYGSDAIGGVIQIFTRGAEAGRAFAPRASIAAGNHGQFRRSAGFSSAQGDTRLDVGASLDEMRGFERTTLPGSRDSAYRNKAANLKLDHSFANGLSAGISALHQTGSTEYDYNLVPAGFAEDDFSLSSVATHLQAQLTARWTSRLELGHSEDRRDTEDPYGGSSFNTYRDQVSWLNNIDLNTHHALTLGADWYEDRLNSSNDYSETARSNRAGFIQHRFTGMLVSSELGLRHDRNQQFGSENTWNGALTWHADDRNDVVLSYSEAFRAPTFNDLYYPDACFPGFGCTVYANPNLTPETARSYELQWRSQLAPESRLELSVYRTRISNAIVTNSALDGNLAGNPNPFRAENIDRARINGFEAAFDQRLLGWDARLAYALVDARNASGAGSDGNRLARRPKNTFNADIDKQLGQFGVGASWQVVSHSYNDLANDRRLPGYGLLGVRGSWQASDALRLALTVDNLLDRDYYQAAGTAFDSAFTRVPFRYREGGRIALLSASWSL
jgi:vitamin B12 transporter